MKTFKKEWKMFGKRNENIWKKEWKCFENLLNKIIHGRNGAMNQVFIRYIEEYFKKCVFQDKE